MGNLQKLIETLTDIGIDLEGEDETILAGLRFELEDMDDEDKVNEHLKEFEQDWLNDIQDANAKSGIITAIKEYRGETASNGKELKEKFANLNYQIQSADDSWIKANPQEFQKMKDELHALDDKIRDMEIATEIIRQLGGFGALKIMTGAYNFIALKRGVSFRLKHPPANYVKIELTGADLYNIEVGRIRGTKYTMVDNIQGAYNDQMKPFLEKATGLTFTMPRVIFPKQAADGKAATGLSVGTGVFQGKENWRITAPSVRGIGIYPKDKYTQEQAEKLFSEKYLNKTAANGRMISIPLDEKNRFVEYVYDFYDGEYSRSSVQKAVDDYLRSIASEEWGGGDSFDREKTYNFLRVYPTSKDYSDYAADGSEIDVESQVRLQLIREMFAEAERLMGDDEYMNLVVDYSDAFKPTASEALQWWTIDNLLNEIQKSDRIDEFIAKAKDIGWADQYARNGKAVGSKYAIAKGYWDQLYSGMNKKQREIYESEHKRLAKYFGDDESSFSDKEVAEYIEGTVRELLDDDFRLHQTSITIPFFKLGHKYIAYWNAYKYPEWWGDDEAKNGRHIELGEDNARIVRTQNRMIQHHAKELDHILKTKKDIPAWVLSKTTRAANDLSDAVHYLDDEKAEDGTLVTKTFRITPYKDMGIPGSELITPIYQMSKTIEGALSQVEKTAKDMLTGDVVQVVVTKVGSTPLQSKNVAIITAEGTRKAADGDYLSKAVSNIEILHNYMVEHGGVITIHGSSYGYFSHGQYNMRIVGNRGAIYNIVPFFPEKTSADMQNAKFFSLIRQKRATNFAITEDGSLVDIVANGTAIQAQPEPEPKTQASASASAPSPSTTPMKLVTFTKKNNRAIKIEVKVYPSMSIYQIDNPHKERFPYVVGQVLNMGHRTWACNNGWLVNDEDPCPEKKIFGMRAKDIPEGHPLRHLYPSKFRSNGGIAAKGKKIEDKPIRYNYKWGTWEASIHNNRPRGLFGWYVQDSSGSGDEYDFRNEIEDEFKTALEAENDMFDQIQRKIGHTPKRQVDPMKFLRGGPITSLTGTTGRDKMAEIEKLIMDRIDAQGGSQIKAKIITTDKSMDTIQRYAKASGGNSVLQMMHGKKRYGRMLYSVINHPETIVSVQFYDDAKQRTYADELALKQKYFQENRHPNLWDDLAKDYDFTEQQLEDFRRATDHLDHFEAWQKARDYNLPQIEGHKTITMQSAGMPKYAQEQLKDAIDQKKNYSYHWDCGWDCSVSVEMGKDGILRGWFSQEFKGIGNGHYWLLISPTQAIFAEND